MKDTSPIFSPSEPGGFAWLTRAFSPQGGMLRLSDDLWTTVEPLLDAHRVAGLLNDRIQNGFIEASLRVQFNLAARLARWTEATREWPALAGGILDAFQSRDIPCLVLKGWALIPLVYDGRRELREVNDLDLLIPRSHLQAADAALLEAGFSIPPQAEVWPGFAHRYSHEALYARRCGTRRPMGVDLHWQAMGSPQLWSRVGHDWFGRAREVVWEGRRMRVPAAEDLFLHLCGHEVIDHARDAEPLLYRFIDLQRLAALPSFSWATLQELACDSSLTGALRSRIEALHGLWPEMIPEGVLDSCRRLPVGPAEREAMREALSRTHALRPSPGLRWIPGWGARLRYFFGKLFPSLSFLRAVYRLPPKASYIEGLLARYGTRMKTLMRT